VVSFTLRPLYPHGGVPGTYCVGGLADPSAALDAVEKSTLPLPGIEPQFFDHPAPSPSTYRLSSGKCVKLGETNIRARVLKCLTAAG
jgi:hypothetical protein